MASKVLTSLPQDAKEFQQRIKRSKVIGIIGYGNQGRSQALNLKDNGFKVIVGNVRDSYYSVAENDGFESYDIATAAETGDILFILIPDEVQPKVFGKEIDPNLGEGKTVVFASGYNYYYGFVVPKKADVLMIAPRMIGWGIRDLFLRKMGFPVLIANDHAGDARKMVLALTDGIGAFQSGGCAIESSFREETLLDLLTEHTWAGAMLFLFRTYFEVATEMGASPW
jgi:ketol-acid reductoisomerase